MHASASRINRCMVGSSAGGCGAANSWHEGVDIETRRRRSHCKQCGEASGVCFGQHQSWTGCSSSTRTGMLAAVVGVVIATTTTASTAACTTTASTAGVGTGLLGRVEGGWIAASPLLMVLWMLQLMRRRFTRLKRAPTATHTVAGVAVFAAKCAVPSTIMRALACRRICLLLCLCLFLLLQQHVCRRRRRRCIAGSRIVIASRADARLRC